MAVETFIEQFQFAELFANSDKSLLRLLPHAVLKNYCCQLEDNLKISFYETLLSASVCNWSGISATNVVNIYRMLLKLIIVTSYAQYSKLVRAEI
jgi:hypothetical protein